MKIAIDVSPLASGHKIRGVGFYLENLKKALLKFFPGNEYSFFTNESEISDDFKIVHYPYFDPFSLSLPIRKNKKIIVTVHDLTPIKFRNHFPAGVKGSIRWQVQKRLLKRASAIIADSNSSKEDIREIIGIDPGKIFVVYLAAAKHFRKLREKPSKLKINGSALPEKFILYVGDVTWNKNLPRIIEAVKKTKYPLVLVGKSIASNDFDRSNPWNSDLKKVQEETRNNKQFMTLGFVSDEDLNLIYNGAGALLMPSIYEGFGLPVIEAMQAGCPVVASSEGSLKEVAGNAALTVDAYSAESIAEGIEKIMNDEKLRSQLVKKGIERAANFSWKKTAGQTNQVYEQVYKSIS